MYQCNNDDCQGKELFGEAPRSCSSTINNEGSKIFKCTSCSNEMELVQCCDKTLLNDEGASPPCRRIIDFDYCHNVLWIKYAGEHSCSVGPNVKPMDSQVVRKYFEDYPSGTPEEFRDFVITQAINHKLNVKEVALQYADLIKIKNIQMQLKKERDPDGTGMLYLQQMAMSLSNNESINDKFLLTVDKDSGLICMTSEERMLIAKNMTMAQNDSLESASVDFCESLFKNYSLMSVTTYSGELRQLVPLLQCVFPKPGECAENVEKGLSKFDEILQKRHGIEFEPCYWTSDNSGAIENGILAVKGITMKSRLGSDKLHDENNLKRVIQSLPPAMQGTIEKEVRLMVNSICPEVSENIYEQLIDKAERMGFKKLHRSLLYHYRKRHKYWNAYREVQDNNATTEQTNRMQTRHCKGASLIEGVHKLVRSAIVDKAKFELAAGGRNVSKGPTVRDRQSRVEKAQAKVMVDVVESLEEMRSLHGSQDSEVSLDSDYYKEKALADFKSKQSDTHRPDKVRRKVSKKVLTKKDVQKNITCKDRDGLSKVWKIMKLKKKVKCSSCKVSLSAGTLCCKGKGDFFCVNRCCLPKTLKTCAPKINIKLSVQDTKLLSQNGIKTS